MWNTNCFEPCISGDIRRYKHLFKGINPNPDDEELGQVKPSKIKALRLFGFTPIRPIYAQFQKSYNNLRE